MATLSPDLAAPAYDVLAPFYDAFTAHHDHEHWVAALERLSRDHGLRGKRVLDVACGTGMSCAPFVARSDDSAGTTSCAASTTG